MVSCSLTSFQHPTSNMRRGWMLLFLALPLCLAQITWLLNQRYKINVQAVYKCADQGSGEIDWNLRLNRLSRQLLVVEGEMFMKVPLDNKIGGNMIVAEKGNGGWIERVFVFKLNRLCPDMHLVLQSGWTSFWEKAGVPPPVKCPIQQGNYTVSNYSTAALEKNTFPGMKQGIFKIDLEFLKRADQTRMGCITFVMSTVSR